MKGIRLYYGWMPRLLITRPAFNKYVSIERHSSFAPDAWMAADHRAMSRFMKSAS